MDLLGWHVGKFLEIKLLSFLQSGEYICSQSVFVFVFGVRWKIGKFLEILLLFSCFLGSTYLVAVFLFAWEYILSQSVFVLAFWHCNWTFFQKTLLRFCWWLRCLLSKGLTYTSWTGQLMIYVSMTTATIGRSLWGLICFAFVFMRYVIAQSAGIVTIHVIFVINANNPYH